MAPLWMLELMERGETLQVVAHEPPRGIYDPPQVTIWNLIRKRFLRLVV